LRVYSNVTKGPHQPAEIAVVGRQPANRFRRHNQGVGGLAAAGRHLFDNRAGQIGASASGCRGWLRVKPVLAAAISLTLGLYFIVEEPGG
jgi:hypothetical protein